MTNTSTQPKDWYNEITQNIIQMLDRGIIFWRKPWRGEMISAQSGKHYQGINEVQLQSAAMAKGYEANLWVTFHEAKKRGGTIRKGEHGVAVFKWVVITKEDEKRSEEDKTVSFMRMAYAGTVFNLAQTDGVNVSDLPTTKEMSRIMSAEAVYANMPNKPTLSHGGNRACYAPMVDKVCMPPLNQFETSEGYYSTLYHELGHSTGHPSRLARKEMMTSHGFGSHDYSLEELVAEFTAAFICAKVGISQPELTTNSAAYIQGWSNKLKSDKALIIHAAQRAQKATNYILGQSEEATL